MYKKIIIIIAIFTFTIAMVYFCTYDKNKVAINSIKTEKELEGITYQKNSETFSDDIIGTIQIDKIGLEADVKEGSTSDILKEFVGHIEKTSLYDGNVGLAAHNRGNTYSYFARLNELENGDNIIYKTRYGNKNYVVIDKKVILETDWSMLKDTEDNRLTLITCIRNKANQRLCVQALENKSQ